MSLDDEEDGTWILVLESALHDGCDIHELISITRGRTLPEEYRAKVWYQCLGGDNKLNDFHHFDEIFDLPEQENIRSHCKTLVDKLGNDEEDKVSVICDTESIFTHYCKSRHLKFDSSRAWTDVLTPLLAVKMPRDHIYASFEEILEKYIPRDLGKGAPVYHLMRLLLLYHDPQLTTILDSKKITPDLFANIWLKSLFSSVCTLDAIAPLWDIYFQERDPFFILFLALVILMNAREEIIGMSEESREKVVQTISNIPSALSVDDVFDFCSLGRFYAVKTPSSFRKEFSTSIFGSIYMGNGNEDIMVGNLPLSQALCLPVSSEEVLETCEFLAEVPESNTEQVGFFLVDCRPSEQYNAGHLPNAFHLDSNLMLQQPASFKTAVQGLFLAQRQALSSGIIGCGKHLCFIGSGREAEDQYVHMVVASFLQRDTQYVSLAKGGYQAFHDLLVHDLNHSLSDHDSSKCISCCPEDARSKTDSTAGTDDLDLPDRRSSKKSQSSKNELDQKSFIDKFSLAFKFKSAEVKGKIVDYITNPNGVNAPLERHVSPSDKGKLYKNDKDVFSIVSDDDNWRTDQQPDDVLDNYELINIPQWLSKPDVQASFKCHQVKENGYTFPSYILCNETLLYVIKEADDGKGEVGYVTARRTLASIVKITSKKRHPDFITFKYGSTLPDGEVSVTDMDRFLIPKASEATKTIKQLLIALIESGNS